MKLPIKLVITVACKAEIPIDWLNQLGIPIVSLKALQSGYWTSLSNTIGVMIIITGVGAKNAHASAIWILDNIKPLFVLNLGTSGAVDPTIPLYTAITPKTILATQASLIEIDTRLPFPNDIPQVIVKTLYSVQEPFTEQAQSLANIMDMEAYFQAKVFKESGISFHVLKIISDHIGITPPTDYFSRLPAIRDKVKQILFFLETIKNQLSISVIIPVFNRPQKIQACIQSILNQTVPPTEIIVVDDGSTDETPNILNQFRDRIQTISLPQNQGVSAARNCGITQSTGDWIALCDSDDTWEPQKLEKQSQFIRQYPFFEIIQSEEIWIRNSKRVNPCNHHQKPEGFIFIPSLELCLISPSAVLLNRSLWNQFGPFDTTLPACEDYDLWLKITRQKPVGLDPSLSVIKYGGDDDQLSKRYPAMDQFRVQSLVYMINQESDPEIKQKIRIILQKKLDILIQGTLKRNNTEKAIFFQKLKADYLHD